MSPRTYSVSIEIKISVLLAKSILKHSTWYIALYLQLFPSIVLQNCLTLENRLRPCMHNKRKKKENNNGKKMQENHFNEKWNRPLMAVSVSCSCLSSYTQTFVISNSFSLCWMEARIAWRRQWFFPPWMRRSKG